VNDAVVDIAIRERLTAYVPFESRNSAAERETWIDQRPSLEQVLILRASPEELGHKVLPSFHNKLSSQNCRLNLI
jgi:hypothetical protein